jgi:hypothetical protein
LASIAPLANRVTTGMSLQMNNRFVTLWAAIMTDLS